MVISIKESWIAAVSCRMIRKPAFTLHIKLLLWDIWGVLGRLSCELWAVAFGKLVLIRSSDRSRQKKKKTQHQKNQPKTKGVKEKENHWNNCVCKIRHPKGHGSWLFPSVPWVFSPSIFTIFSILNLVNHLRHLKWTVPVVIYVSLVLEVKLQVGTLLYNITWIENFWYEKDKNWYVYSKKLKLCNRIIITIITLKSHGESLPFSENDFLLRFSHGRESMAF